MTQQLFDDAIGTPPPSTVDTGRIVRRERRRGVLLRSGVVAAALVAVAAVPLALSTADGPPDTARPSTAIQLGGPRAAADLRAALDDALRAAAPEARWTTGEPPALRGDPDAMLVGRGAVQAGGKVGDLRITIYDTRNDVCGAADPNCPAEPAATRRVALLRCDGQPDCTERTGPRRVTQRTSASEKVPGATYSANTVRIELPDRRILALDALNAVGGTPKQAEPPLTIAQLTAMCVALAGKIQP